MTAGAAPDRIAALAAQVGRLRRMEADNPVYREMLAAAEDHRDEPARGADGLTRAEREAAIDAGQIRLTR